METCAICGEQCEPALYRQKPEGTVETLCKSCSDTWLQEDTDFPQQPYITIYVLQKVYHTK